MEFTLADLGIFTCGIQTGTRNSPPQWNQRLESHTLERIDIMQNVYPVLISKDKDYYLVYIPDVDGMTQGNSLYEAMYMARDYLGTYSLDSELPEPSSVEQAVRLAEQHADSDDFKWSAGTPYFIDIDTDAYRRQLNTKAIRKNCTIPSWLNDKAEAAGINFSRVLQDALLDKLR